MRDSSKESDHVFMPIFQLLQQFDLFEKIFKLFLRGVVLQLFHGYFDGFTTREGQKTFENFAKLTPTKSLS